LGRLFVLAKNRPKKCEKINELPKHISRTPFDIIGKPEPLKHKYAGFMSRRIDDEHRFIYRFLEDEIQILNVGFITINKRFTDSLAKSKDLVFHFLNITIL
jgi:Txe/YoeB family toxin of toxin-antitoxin system